MKVLLFIFLLSVLNAYSQSAFGDRSAVSDNSSDVFVNGIYTSLETLLDHQPIITGIKFDTLLRDMRKVMNCTSSKKKDDTIVNNILPEYPCVNTEADIKKLLLKEANLSIDSVWGFYDGRFTYMRFDGNFYPIVTWGTYSIINYYINHKSNKLDNPLLRTVVLGIPPGKSHYPHTTNDLDEVFKETGSGVHIGKKEQLLLSVETGDIFPFNTAAILTILKEDTVLYNQFMKEKRNEENNIYYLFKFNERHPLRY